MVAESEIYDGAVTVLIVGKMNGGKLKNGVAGVDLPDTDIPPPVMSS